MQSATGLAALANLVGGIVGVRSEEQVIWIDAKGVVAAMAYLQTRRYFALVDLIGQTMGEMLLGIDGNHPIARPMRATHPKMASAVWLRHGIEI